jgi:hypothetical protein
VALSTATLITVAQQHFDWEERLMLAQRYDDCATHKAQHDRLLDQLLEVERGLATGRIVSSQILSLFIESWTEQHVLDAVPGRPASVGAPTGSDHGSWANLAGHHGEAHRSNEECFIRCAQHGG